MIRQEYIQLRVDNRFDLIIYNYFVEHKKTLLKFEQFTIYFNKWLLVEQENNRKIGIIVSTNNIVDYILDNIMLYFDTKFNIHYLTITKETKTTEKQTLIL